MITIIKKVLYSNVGRIIISIILGIGLASLFRKVCKDRNCMVFKGPQMSELKDQVYNHNNACYEFKEKSIKCGEREKSVNFS